LGPILQNARQNGKALFRLVTEVYRRRILNPGINLNNSLLAVFTLADPNGAKKTDALAVFFVLSAETFQLNLATLRPKRVFSF